MVVEDRFWRSPDLVSQLLPFLDSSSTLALASVQPLVVQLLQRSSIWKGLLRRSTIEDFDDYDENNKSTVEDLVGILKMMGDPVPLLLELLHIICEKFLNYGRYNHISVSCTLHPAADHKVNQEGFELLELVEGAMKTSLQKVKECSLNEMDGLSLGQSLALVARINRQKEPLRKVDTEVLPLLADTGITATILQNALKVETIHIYLQSDFGEEGWAWLAEVLQRNGSMVQMVSVSKVVMARARKADLKAVWDATHFQYGCWLLTKHFYGQLPNDEKGRSKWMNSYAKDPSDLVIETFFKNDLVADDLEWPKIEGIWEEEKSRRRKSKLWKRRRMEKAKLL